MLNINKRVIHRPLVVVEKTINFDGQPIPMAGTTQDSVENEKAYDEYHRVIMQQGESGEDR